MTKNELFKRISKLGTPINVLIGYSRSAEGLRNIPPSEKWISSMIENSDAAGIAWDQLIHLIEEYSKEITVGGISV